MKSLAVFLLSVGATASLLAADLPSGESLISRCIEREGGKVAVARAQSSVMTGTVEVVGHNLSGPLEVYQHGDKTYTAIDLSGIGRIEEGFDGETAWESNILQGTRIKDGEELEAARRASRMSVLSSWKDYYKSAVTVGAEDVDGKPAWKVNMTPKQGSPESYFFGQESGLIVKIVQTLATALGDIPVEMMLGEYRLVDGVQTPFLMLQSAMSQNMKMRFDKIVYGADIPASRFDLPPAVKALLAKKKP